MIQKLGLATVIKAISLRVLSLQHIRFKKYGDVFGKL